MESSRALSMPPRWEPAAEPKHPHAGSAERRLAYVLIAASAAPLPFQPVPWGFTLFPFALVLFPLLSLWLAERSVRGTVGHPAAVRIDGVLVAMLLLAFSLAVSATASGGGWRPFFLWLYLSALYAFARYRLPRLIPVERLAQLLIALIVVMAGICAVQFLTLSTFGALATYFPGGEAQNARVLGVNGLKRVQGPFYGTNILAQWLTFASLWLIAATRAIRVRGVFVAMVLSSGMVLLTFSRGSWLIVPLATASLVALLYRTGLLPASRIPVLVLVSLLVLGLGAQFAPASWFERFRADRGSTRERNDAMRAGVAVIHARPAFGSGYGRFVDVAFDLGYVADLRPHNVFVQVFAEHGVLPLATYALLLGAIFREARRRSKCIDATRALGLAVLVAVIVWIAFMLFYETANDYAVTPIIFLLFGYSLASPLYGEDASTAP